MQSAERNAATLQQHMLTTYKNLRLGIAVIGGALPLLLWFGEAVVKHESLLAALRGSMSAYYYTAMGDVFVGALVMVGASLYLYKGYSTKENWALNAAGALAVGVALVPKDSIGMPVHAHDIFAASLFLCIAYVAIFRAGDTLSLTGWSPAKTKWFQRIYRLLGIAMLISPLAAIIVSYSFPASPNGSPAIFFIEAFAVWIFASYWAVKSYEINRSRADHLAAAGRIQVSPELEKSDAPGRLAQV